MHHFVHAFTGSPADATPAPQNPKGPSSDQPTHHIGRLTRAAQLRSTGDKARATFTIAVDGYNGKTEFLPVTVFGRTAETVAEFTDKGNLVCVEGRITSGKYTNDAGETVYTLDVIDARVGFISKPRNATATPDSVDPDADTETA